MSLPHPTPTRVLIKALRILARDLVSEDGVAEAAILEAADRLENHQAILGQIAHGGLSARHHQDLATQALN